MLTGVAAVLTAAATLGALFIGGGGDSTDAGAPPGGGSAPTFPAAAAVSGCFKDYFAGIAGYRLGKLEVGSSLDVLSETEPKAGQIGLTFTDVGRPIGGIRFVFFPENAFYKIVSVVDGQCRPIEDYENRTGGDKHAWPDSSTIRIRLGGRLYDLTANGAGSIVRVGIVSVAP